jgi:peptidylprolyl isomerase
MVAATGLKHVGRREAIAAAVGAGVTMLDSSVGAAPMDPPDDEDLMSVLVAPSDFPAGQEPISLLCGSDCLADIAKAPKVKTASGLEYRDIVKGTGVSPAPGFPVCFHVIAQLPNGMVFMDTVEKGGSPIDAKIGNRSIAPVGLEEGLTTMQVGGVRRIYCPGELSYTSIPSAAGAFQPPAFPGTPVIFDVQLLLVPGAEAEDEDFKFRF